ncbi:aldo/keto reductase [Pendulispora rubella]|uniref:Aldo/keto reductase n=1 Tax=Pendulispora rubella TaxID=2741070 RepID=A0ABZ2KP57_9BACT
MEPRISDDLVLKAIAQRMDETPAHVALAWAVQRGTAFLTTSTNPDHIRENFEISPLPAEALQEIRNGMPGFIPQVPPPPR